VDIAGIMHAIPHRYPFLLIDVWSSWCATARRSASRTCRSTRDFSRAIPRPSRYAGVLIIESMAQTAAVLVVETLDRRRRARWCISCRVEGAKFRRPVVPATSCAFIAKSSATAAMYGNSTPSPASTALRSPRRTYAAMIMDKVATGTSRELHSSHGGRGARRHDRRRRAHRPFCSIGPDVSIGAGAELVSHVVVDGHTSIGPGAKLFPFCTVAWRRRT